VNGCRLAKPTRVVHDSELTCWIVESFYQLGGKPERNSLFE
jgi:hypothetical protein